MIFLIIFLFVVLFNSSHQKVPPRNTNFCQEGSSCINGPDDPIEMLQNLNKRKDEMVKQVLFETLKDTFSKMKLPNEFAGKVNNEDFLKEAIDAVIQKETENAKGKRKVKSEDDQKEKVKSAINEKINFQFIQSSYKYEPKNSRVDIHDWHDFYHYFPHFSSAIRLWKLEFKESARRNWKKFRGCANPGRLIDWLVPDGEEVKKAKRRSRQMSRRERQRDF